MRNLTLAIEHEVLEAARRLALERGTTVNQLVRDHLADLVARENRRRAAAERLKRAMQEERVEIGPAAWTREDLHAR
ncbi:MAG TPA: hypothetical protein VF121_00810 [Thermoanaerobaculia bacterium]|nr:hypothetical protein [Thermoanaerobaculia bacterium]